MSKSALPAYPSPTGPWTVVPLDCTIFHLLVESVSDYAIFLLDVDGRVATWNSGAQRIKGYAAEEIIGQHFSKFYPPEAIKSGVPQVELKRATADRRVEMEGWRVRKDGAQFWAHVVITALYGPEKRLIGFAKVTQDLTERKFAEDKLRRAHDLLEIRVRERTTELEMKNCDLQAAIASAESANRAKTVFLSRMSHELRTPLNAILGFGQLMEMGARSKNDQESVHYILKSGKRLLKLVNEVLDMEKLQTASIELSLEPVEIGAAILEALQLLVPLSSAKRVRVEFRPAAPYFVAADKQRLTQTFVNLISNGIQYNKEGGSLRISCTNLNQRIRVEFADTGPGLAPGDMERIFAPFERLGEPNTQTDGAGLGLALSKGLVEAMGGKLGADSTEGEGATFWVELACAQVPPPGDATASQAALGPSQDAFTVLAIDDNPSNIHLLERIAANRPDWRLISALQGGTGFQLAELYVPDMILLDVHLPDIMGYDVLANLKRNPTTAHIPVVVISADATSSQNRRLMAGGAEAYLTKPLDVKELLRIVDEAVAKKSIDTSSRPNGNDRF